MIETLRDLIFGKSAPITKNSRELEALTNSTYVMGIIFSILLIGIAVIVTKSILSNPNGTHVRKRKMWFWILAAVAPLLFGLYNFLGVTRDIKGSMLVNKFQAASTINFFIMFALYVALGVLISFVFRKGKLGDWFFSSKKYRS